MNFRWLNWLGIGRDPAPVAPTQDTSPALQRPFMHLQHERERPDPPRNGELRPPSTLPPGYRLLGDGGPEFFDPAVQHYRCAFRHAEPVFERPEDGERWRAARQRVMDHVLALIARSSWQQRLVLRGSALLRTQLGAAARKPGDIDWVVLPAELKASDPSGIEIVQDIAGLIGSRPRIHDILIDADHYAIGAIWTYERAEGRRLTMTWSVDGLPPGTVQQDFVYGEPLPETPPETDVVLGDGTTVPLLAASPALSLCWKLLWLGSDMHPQGKDLYDAVLLAERTPLPPDLLDAVRDHAEASPQGVSVRVPLEIDEWHVDWKNFQLEYPGVEGELAAWKRRLAAALAHTDGLVADGQSSSAPAATTADTP
jgi:hypothetical protein